jgi:membrane-associated phospholipid phosphatase
MGSVAHRADNPRWYDRCWLVDGPRPLTVLAQALRFVFDPILVVLSCEILLVLFHFTEFTNKPQIQSHLATAHHFLLPSMVTVVGLFVIFKQRRPGLQRRPDGTLAPLGTFYGMPSGDAFMFATVASALWASGRKFAGGLVAVLVSFERVFLGLHDVRQVMAGVAFGVATYAAFAVGNRLLTVIVNWVLALFLPLLVFLDPALADVEIGDFSNLQGWVIVDMGYVWFDFVYCAPRELRLITGDGLRLAVAVVGELAFHVAYTYQVQTGLSLVRWWQHDCRR